MQRARVYIESFRWHQVNSATDGRPWTGHDSAEAERIAFRSILRRRAGISTSQVPPLGEAGVVDTRTLVAFTIVNDSTMTLYIIVS